MNRIWDPAGSRVVGNVNPRAAGQRCSSTPRPTIRAGIDGSSSRRGPALAALGLRRQLHPLLDHLHATPDNPRLQCSTPGIRARHPPLLPAIARTTSPTHLGGRHFPLPERHAATKGSSMTRTATTPQPALPRGTTPSMPNTRSRSPSSARPTSCSSTCASVRRAAGRSSTASLDRRRFNIFNLSIPTGVRPRTSPATVRCPPANAPPNPARARLFVLARGAEDSPPRAPQRIWLRFTGAGKPAPQWY